MAPPAHALASLGLEPEVQLRGSGASKRVYSGRVAATNEPVALVSAPNDTYERENEVFIRLGNVPPHPSLVLARAACTVGACTYYIADLLVTDLFDLITDGGVPGEQRVLGLVSQLLSGMVFMHRLGVAHLDLKFENIGIDAAGRVRIFDFDISMLAVPLLHPKPALECPRRLGTKSYRAPEMWLADEETPCDPYKADIWSMGVVVFSLLFGFFPFDVARPSDRRFVVARYAQATNQSTLAALIGMYPGNQEAANTLAGLSGRTRNILEGMLTIAPEQRASLEALAALLPAQLQAEFRAVASDFNPTAPEAWKLRDGVAFRDLNVTCCLLFRSLDDGGSAEEPTKTESIDELSKCPLVPPRIVRQNVEAVA